MELKQIKDLMAAMGRTRLKRLKIKNDNFELELEREEKVVKQVVEHMPEAYARAETEIPRVKAPDIPASLHPPVDHDSAVREEKGTFITSPMVGTFYSASGPDEPFFVKVGDRVTEESVVCIVEAMKVMNEVKAGVSGVISEVLVENGHPVEFGTKLFKVS
ncbi:acetyl-CoA carboxylase biotin carboxyl carrier protein [Waddlia chondrophila]|uniref:Biotin carboxyl carrier protein of acetyl-CoA carboxylase n=1 Tax=Waddlia chondrophila (strain ATCC VR-1470 / WSU 86-1044) TaxID=716544 RepID=D6YVS3_WADCW|nr:acetyl-CoA carboxylase biotin carboxyl carrier protein [Waddlia chondrophila]ADI38234.1 acetyl-CoA carboxylase biotin carboxyl carrier protein [Waddlia chondrophila WSU 86-1044]